MWSCVKESNNYSQPQLLKCLHRVERRGGVPLLDLHLVPVPHQRATDKLI